jgi:hypothetical protein
LGEKSKLDNFKNDQEKGARRAVLEELFNDYYIHRRRVYKMNFFRGIFFGLGSVIGGTIVLAIAVWLMTLFIDFPVIGDYFQSLKQAIEQTRNN